MDAPASELYRASGLREPFEVLPLARSSANKLSHIDLKISFKPSEPINITVFIPAC